MSASWQSSFEVFNRILRLRGVDPDAVADVRAAWAAFEDFLQTQVDGLAAGEDVDGYIVQWGRWNDNRPSLSFARQLAIPDAEEPEGQPSYWQVELEMTFSDVPSLVDLDELNESNTGFSFEPIGPTRTAALTSTLDHYLMLYPQLRILFDSAPTESCLSLQQAD